MDQILPVSVAAGLAIAGALLITGYSVAAPVPHAGPQVQAELPATPAKSSPDEDLQVERRCIPADQMLGVFALDAEHLGGEILALGDGLQQAFADSWRKNVGLPAVPVTQVFAHVVPGQDGASIVDVVEIDENGCALSRTLLSMESWLEILKPLQSVEV